MRNHSYENDFDLHENETACRTHFLMKGLARRLVLKQRHKSLLGRTGLQRPVLSSLFSHACLVFLFCETLIDR